MGAGHRTGEQGFDAQVAARRQCHRCRAASVAADSRSSAATTHPQGSDEEEGFWQLKCACGEPNVQNRCPLRPRAPPAPRLSGRGGVLSARTAVRVLRRPTPTPATSPPVFVAVCSRLNNGQFLKSSRAPPERIRTINSSRGARVAGTATTLRHPVLPCRRLSPPHRRRRPIARPVVLLTSGSMLRPAVAVVQR